MPATAGRVRMPANNRVHSSAALQTHGIWQSAIGYDPYAPTAKDDGKKASTTSRASDSAEPEPENAYASFQGLLALARITNSNSDEARGSCKKCGRVGHLTYQCRNFLSVREDVNRGGKVDDDVIREVVLEKLKGKKVKGLVKEGGLESGESSEEEEEEDSESSDSDYDSEMERIIAEKYGKKVNGKAKVVSRRKAEEEEDDDDEDEEDRRKKRGRSKKRRNRKRENNDSEDEERTRRKRRKERRNRDDDESSDEEDELKRRKKRKSRKERRRRRSHRHSSDYSDASSEDSGDRRRKRRSRRTASTSDSDNSGSDDPRVGRDKRRSEKKSRKSRHGDED